MGCAGSATADARYLASSQEPDEELQSLLSYEEVCQNAIPDLKVMTSASLFAVVTTCPSLLSDGVVPCSLDTTPAHPCWLLILVAHAGYSAALALKGVPCMPMRLALTPNHFLFDSFVARTVDHPDVQRRS